MGQKEMEPRVCVSRFPLEKGTRQNLQIHAGRATELRDSNAAGREPLLAPRESALRANTPGISIQAPESISLIDKPSEADIIHQPQS